MSRAEESGRKSPLEAWTHEIEALARNAACVQVIRSPPPRVWQIENLGIIRGIQEHVKIFAGERIRGGLWTQGRKSKSPFKWRRSVETVDCCRLLPGTLE